jgi:hypothetical protein
MVKSAQIRVFVLSVVYFILLTALFLPHHHHEETACYTTTHCEDDISGHDQHGEEPVDHHHDHETPENPQNCLSFEYYVSANSGANLKRALDNVISFEGAHNFLYTCFVSVKEDIELAENNLFVRNKQDKKHYTTIIKNELPLRAPPTFSS